MDSSTRTVTGRRIANIRRHRGMTQQHLADAIGVTRHVIFHLEHSHTRIDYEQLERIAAALHCTIEDLRGAPDAPMPRIRFRGARPFPGPAMVPVMMDSDG
jgi:transcriptional regulator with XRE-family HTH domain